MLTINEKKFFIGIAIGAGKLSECSNQQGAILIQGKKILSYGLNRDIIKGGKWNLSAIFDALFGSKEQDLTGAEIFSSYFPSLEDLMLSVSVGISSIYFLGKIKDQKSVEFLNSLEENHIPLKIIHLE